ncbi:MAG: hypothetical protein M1454_02960 [Candidatus Thermoplasmatota archaeon]|nr:hypothetical protein [Candidatus Thermoplasmatota archaeon]
MKICEIGMAGEVPTENDLFPGMEKIPGGVESNARIEDGHSILSFRAYRCIH